MCQLLESIRWENGKFENLDLHQDRMERAAQAVLGIDKKFDLKELISVPNNLKSKRYKCRILYDTKIREVDFSIYNRKKISTIKLLVDEKIAYPHKFADRDCINLYTNNLKNEEEVIFVKNGMLRDASYSNIALFDGEEWHTPNYPLLKGTKRAELLKTAQIRSKKLRPEDLGKYQRISFINALNDLDELSLDL